jgi:hypothetical protein
LGWFWLCVEQTRVSLEESKHRWPGISSRLVDIQIVASARKQEIAMHLSLRTEGDERWWFGYLEPVAQEMFLPLSCASGGKTAEIGAVMALVACQEPWCIAECGRTDDICCRGWLWNVLTKEKVSGSIFEYINIAELVIEVWRSMQKQQSILLALSIVNRIEHESRGNPLMTIVRVCHYSINTARA